MNDKELGNVESPQSKNSFLSTNAIIAGSVVALTLAIVMGLMSRFKDLFKDMGVSLPPVTKLYVYIADTYWLLLVAPLVTILFLSMFSGSEDAESSTTGVILIVIACAIFIGVGVAAVFMPLYAIM
ncbi:hypothetical protein ACFL54_09255 [Planctomycetota bacterium]